MPTPEEQVFTKGASLVPSIGAIAALIEQSVELAVPTSYRGMVIYSETTPATSGEPSGYPSGWYEWHKRCLWLKPSTGEIFQWTGTIWSLSVAKPGANTITGSMIATATIPLSKLLPDVGSSLKIPRVKLDESGYEYVAASDLFAANGLAISKLDGTSAGNYVLTRAAGSKSWTVFDSATIIGLFSANEFPIDYLARGSALQVPMTNAAGTAITWASVLTGIADYSFPLTKISKTVADAGKWLRVQPDGSVLAETMTPTAASVNFASASEVITGTEAAKAVAPSTVRYIPGAYRAYGSIALTVNDGGTDLLIGAAIVSGAVGLASVTVTSGSLPSTIRVVFSEAILATRRLIFVYPLSSGASTGGALLAPPGTTYLPGTNTYTVTRVNDTTFDISWSTLSVPSTDTYHIEIYAV